MKKLFFGGIVLLFFASVFLFSQTDEVTNLTKKTSINFETSYVELKDYEKLLEFLEEHRATISKQLFNTIELNEKIKNLLEENKNLKINILNLGYTLPDSIRLEKRNIYNNQAYFIFKTEPPKRFCKLKAILDGDGQSKIIRSEINNVHIIHFENLKLNIHYTVRAYVLNNDDSQNNSKMTNFIKNSNLKFRIIEDKSISDYDEHYDIMKIAPTNLDIKHESSTHNSITFKPKVDKDSWIEVEYNENHSPLIKKIGNIKISKIGALPDKSSDNKYFFKKDSKEKLIIKNLKSNTSYVFKFEAINEGGIISKFNNGIPVTYKTNDIFKFIDGIELEINPLQSYLRWKVTQMPTKKSLKIRAKFRDASDFTNMEANVNVKVIQKDKLFLCTAPVNFKEIFKFISSNNFKTIEPPQFHIKLSKNGKTIERTVKIFYNFPTKDQIEKSQLEKNDKKDMIKLVKKMGLFKKRKGKLNFSELLKTGLPALLKYFL